VELAVLICGTRDIPWRPVRRNGRVPGVLTVPPDALHELSSWFSPERPGPLIYQHIARTGHGRCRVDRWPDPRVVLAEVPGNCALRGDPDGVTPEDLADVVGFVEAPPEWLPTLRAADPGTAVWDRVIAVLPKSVPTPPPHPEVRRLTAADDGLLRDLSPDCAWISATWGGPEGLLAAEVAHAVVVDGRAAAVAVPFFIGDEHEDIGVVTEAAHRKQGLSTACSGAVVTDIRARGHVPTWTTSPDNAASLGVAKRLGFRHMRDDVLYAVRAPIPRP
jgi:RimJ/RimL family protein N-acetyltransferase